MVKGEIQTLSKVDKIYVWLQILWVCPAFCSEVCSTAWALAAAPPMVSAVNGLVSLPVGRYGLPDQYEPQGSSFIGDMYSVVCTS